MSEPEDTWGNLGAPGSGGALHGGTRGRGAVTGILDKDWPLRVGFIEIGLQEGPESAEISS